LAGSSATAAGAGACSAGSTCGLDGATAGDATSVATARWATAGDTAGLGAQLSEAESVATKIQNAVTALHRLLNFPSPERADPGVGKSITKKPLAVVEGDFPLYFLNGVEKTHLDPHANR
jgi:hypothetical protein